MGDSFSMSLIFGVPVVAIRYRARSGFSLRYGGSPSSISNDISLLHRFGIGS